MATTGLPPILEFVARNYKNFNARATRDALFAYWDHVRSGGKHVLGRRRRDVVGAARHHARARRSARA
jgi:hypothetical protein